MSVVSKPLGLQAFSFLLVGGLTALLYFGLIFAGIELLKFNYLVCVSLAYILSVSFHFLANRWFTFRAATGNTRRQLRGYAALLALNYVVTITVVVFCVDYLGFSTYFASAMAIAVTVGVGFVVSKFWVFNQRKPDCEQ